MARLLVDATAEVPSYDISLSRRVGTCIVELGETELVIAEGIRGEGPGRCPGGWGSGRGLVAGSAAGFRPVAMHATRRAGSRAVPGEHRRYQEPTLPPPKPPPPLNPERPDELPVADCI